MSLMKAERRSAQQTREKETNGVRRNHGKQWEGGKVTSSTHGKKEALCGNQTA